MELRKGIFIGAVLLLAASGVLATGNKDSSNSSEENSSSVSEDATSTSGHNHSASSATHKRLHTSTTTSVNQQRHSTILKKMVYYTNHESAGPTHNYYWVVGKAHFTGFGQLKPGAYHFANDQYGRSATAKAVLTYSEYQSSRGARQGDPLAPPAWPDNNPKVAITYSLTGDTYHGYLYNRSHSIADSLLGSKSYTSQYNFTTGTRPQNVGANQSGGMRYAEETAENYWTNHPGTSNTIDYETTPLYEGQEQIPRGSVVNIKSSDGAVNTEVAVINSVEGIKINYNNGSSNAKPITTQSSSKRSASSYSRYGSESHTSSSRRTNSATRNAPSTSTHSTTKEGQWTVAASGMVFVSESHKYYSRVTNPGNYTYESESQANASGATRAPRGNEYARP